MGADMTLCCVPACDLTPQRIQRLEQVLQAIPDDDPDLANLMEMLGYDSAQSARLGVLTKCQAIQPDRRDVCVLSLPGCPYQLQVSGGLSWGDPPTEAYTVLEHVELCPQAWHLLEEFARADCLAAQPPRSD